jgi:pimeloyl-ACP methyl ester carboxylesterase
MIGLRKTLAIGVSILLVCLAGNILAFADAKPSLADGNDAFSHDERRVVTVGNLHVTYIESGTGHPVVLLHGNAGGVEDFEYGAVEELAREYRVIAIDRPGHGESDRPDGDFGSVEYQSEFLHQTLANLSIEHPILVGHSWGGALALAYALKYPSEVSGMVLLAPAAYPDKGANFLLRIAAKVPLVGEIGVLLGQSIMGRQMLQREVQRAFYPAPVPDSYRKLVMASWLGRKQLKAFFEDEVDLNDSLKEMVPQYHLIKMPVVILTGDKDMIVSPKQNAFRLIKAIRQAHLIELKNTGHEIPQTNPKSVVSAVRLING